MYVDVLTEVLAVSKVFTYSVPSGMKVLKGVRVLIPFGPRILEGFVTNIHDEKPSFEVKDIIKVIDQTPVLNEELFSLGEYISKKTLTSLMKSYQTMLPTALKAKSNFTINKKYETYVKLIDKSYVAKNESQDNIIKLLKSDKLKSEVNKISMSSLNTLIKNKVVSLYEKEVYRGFNDIEVKKNNIKLNSEQKSVVKEVVSNLNTFTPYLLKGVTGSGKTEVYMNIIAAVMKNNKSAIVLVPEISLTPQLVRVFKERFGSQIAILHSRLSQGEKYDEWRRIEELKVKIVIGARSAIFAPLVNLGVIIIDEEHSLTYKQENNPMYHAIDIALKRGKYNNCPVVLGSATPSIESYTRAKQGIYKLLELNNRINNMLPKVSIVNMRDEFKKGNRVISEELKLNIESSLKRGNQVIILLNRRGYSTTITCNNCGHVEKCPNCDIPLIYHKQSNNLRCHYCGYAKKKEDICKECGSKLVSEYGMGTEKLEELLNNMFNARIVRMDLDTTTRKGAHEKIINDFGNHKYDILIGTEMIAKGLDFKDVTVVGVLNGDSSLMIPDFRSSERTFNLLNQVAGRAGRSDKEGKVIIQVFDDTHYSIKYASIHDYDSFYEEEMRIRKILKYPPFSNICLIKIKGKDYQEVSKEANKIKSYLNSKLNITILGPTPSMMAKVNNIYNFNIILKYMDTKIVINPITFIVNKYQNNKNIKVTVDFNPIKF